MVLPKFCLETVALRPESFLLIFLLGQNPSYSKKWAPRACQVGGKAGGMPRGAGHAPTLVAAWWVPWQSSGGHLLLYEVFYPGKNHKQAFGTKHRRHKAEPI